MKETRPTPRTIATIPGLVIGALCLAMGIAAVWTSAAGYANHRAGWGLGWGIVGFFLVAAGLAALIGTWWHNSRSPATADARPHASYPPGDSSPDVETRSFQKPSSSASNRSGESL